MQTSVLKVSAYFTLRDASAAIAFYQVAFGATELFRMTDPGDGRIGHAELQFGETVMMVSDEYPDFGALCPDTIGGTPVTFHLTTASVDQMVTQALAAGATLLRPAKNQSYGERVAMVLDPFGYRWMLAETIEAVSPQDMQQRWEAETLA